MSEAHSAQASVLDIKLPEHQLILNDDVLVTHGRVLPWENIATAVVENRPAASLRHSPKRRVLQILFYVAMMVCSALVAFEYIGGWWLGVIAAAFLLGAWQNTRRLLLPTVLLNLQGDERLPLLQTPDHDLAERIAAQINQAAAEHQNSAHQTE